jgi:hypothetical protein
VQQGELRASIPTLAALDEEFGGADQIAPEPDYQPRRRRRYVWLLIPSAVLAAISAFFSINGTQPLWSFAQLLPSSLAAQTADGGSAAESITELQSLKKEISELRNGQQNMSAEITALQVAQQELQRSSPKMVSWHSEPVALLYQQIAAAQKPQTIALRRKITQPRPAKREANVNSENRSGLSPPTRIIE